MWISQRRPAARPAKLDSAIENALRVSAVGMGPDDAVDVVDLEAVV
jgi:hypothetical protein